MLTILLVEDNDMNRDMIAQYLGHYGYKVVTAREGSAAVELARTAEPALILMDISLPVLDGWEATRQIKAAPETKSIPVIALTAHAMASDRQKSIEAGCDDYEPKPIDFARLIGKMRALLKDDA
ncbi:MAG TPA: response regulator [Roseiflexaceae bacterium]|nr:response regulator [Roseiflexaceae bacterium]